LDRGAAIERRHPCTVDGTTGGEPVLYTREQLERIRAEMGPYTWAAQMMLDPASERDMAFDISWLKHYDPAAATDTDPAEQNVYIIVDPASSKKKGSDYTVMAVIALGADGNYRLIDAVRDRLSLTERARELFRLHRKHQAGLVGYEKYGILADIEYLEEEMRRQSYHFRVIELGGRLAKEERIRRLIPLFEQGRFYIPKALWRTTLEGRHLDLVKVLEEEFTAFPVSEHDDFLVAVSRIMDGELETFCPQPAEKKVIDRYADVWPRRRRSISQWAY